MITHQDTIKSTVPTSVQCTPLSEWDLVLAASTSHTPSLETSRDTEHETEDTVPLCCIRASHADNGQWLDSFIHTNTHNSILKWFVPNFYRNRHEEKNPDVTTLAKPVFQSYTSTALSHTFTQFRCNDSGVFHRVLPGDGNQRMFTYLSLNTWSTHTVPWHHKQLSNLGSNLPGGSFSTPATVHKHPTASPLTWGSGHVGLGGTPDSLDLVWAPRLGCCRLAYPIETDGRCWGAITCHAPPHTV